MVAWFARASVFHSVNSAFPQRMVDRVLLVTVYLVIITPTFLRMEVGVICPAEYSPQTCVMRLWFIHSFRDIELKWPMLHKF